MAKNKKIEIYDLDYLVNTELTEEDLYNIFETPSLNYSLVINMFKISGYNKTNEEIIDLCKTDDRWMYKHFWTSKQRKEFHSILVKICQNIYQYGYNQSEGWADWWLFMYGLSNKKNK